MPIHLFESLIAYHFPNTLTDNATANDYQPPTFLILVGAPPVHPKWRPYSVNWSQINARSIQMTVTAWMGDGTSSLRQRRARDCKCIYL